MVERPGSCYDIPSRDTHAGGVRSRSTPVGLGRIAASDATPTTDPNDGALHAHGPEYRGRAQLCLLHAVASRAGFSCEFRNRHLDGAGIDATSPRTGGAGRRLDPDLFSVDIQLKATYRELPDHDGRLSYVLSVPHYDKLRLEEVAAPRLLVLMRLPHHPEEWLQLPKRPSSRGDAPTGLASAGPRPARTTIPRRSISPRAESLVPRGLTDLMACFSRLEVFPYVA